MSALGIPLALVATTSYSAGLILEKRALGSMPDLDLRRPWLALIRLVSEPAWLAGFSFMVAGMACQTVALTIAPVSVVQPVLSSGVAIVLVLSWLVLREQLGRKELVCVAAVAASIVVLALSATGSGGATGHHANAGRLAAVAIPSALIGLLVAVSPLRGRARKHRAPTTGVAFGLGIGLLYGVATLATKALSGILISHHAIVTGILGSPYLYLFGCCTVAAMLLYQIALQGCRASIVIPVNSITGSLYFLVTGTWLFHEQLPSSPVKLAMRLTAIAVTGVVLIMLSQQQSGSASAGGRAVSRVAGRPSARVP
jgi:drug/metabolite transporter (DMT)-like permease